MELSPGSWTEGSTGAQVDDITNFEECHDAFSKAAGLFAGYLTKLGGWSMGVQALKRPQRRWFVLQTPYLRYYSSPEDASKPNPVHKGEYCLVGASVAEVSQHPQLSGTTWPHVISITVDTPVRKVSHALLPTAKTLDTNRLFFTDGAPGVCIP